MHSRFVLISIYSLKYWNSTHPFPYFIVLTNAVWKSFQWKMLKESSSLCMYYWIGNMHKRTKQWQCWSRCPQTWNSYNTTALAACLPKTWSCCQTPVPALEVGAYFFSVWGSWKQISDSSPTGRSQSLVWGQAQSSAGAWTDLVLLQLLGWSCFLCSFALWGKSCPAKYEFYSISPQKQKTGYRKSSLFI